ncbi:hypothetical protein OEV98_11145 [Caldibacillus lycopersici]|uniref:Uncharacterized protein n=1 Tax=Perspicuibacillus lycopersici TaxID=1325689 RepID=A0AAE3ITD6_9BACI|nr:hypothetical protein [Perspicuibacillus lycopersici]MCU9614116.1 hypothetical protein [Perspicuibacillus lycopersici]
MCELCNGTHVVHTQDNFTFGFFTCPICGPASEELLAMERKKRQKRYLEMEQYFIRNGWMEGANGYEGSIHGSQHEARYENASGYR